VKDFSDSVNVAHYENDYFNSKSWRSNAMADVEIVRLHYFTVNHKCFSFLYTAKNQYSLLRTGKKLSFVKKSI